MGLPYFPFYAADWLSDPKVKALTYEQRGVYIEMLAQMWLYSSERCYLPDDPQFICNAFALRAEQWHALRTQFVDSIAPIFLSVNGDLINKRLCAEWARARAKTTQRTTAARTRWGKSGANTEETPTKSHDANAMQTQCKRNAGKARLAVQTKGYSESESESDPERGDSRAVAREPSGETRPESERRKTTYDVATLTAMKDALKDGVGWAHAPSRTEWGVIQKVAKELLDCGITAAEVPAFIRAIWDRQAWRTTLTPGELPKLVHVYRQPGPVELESGVLADALKSRIVEDEALWGRYKE